MLRLAEPTAQWFEQVAERHFPKVSADPRRGLAKAVVTLRSQAGQLRKPSTAEFLDAVRVCKELRISQTSEAWRFVVGSVLLKTDRPQAERQATETPNGAK